MRLILSEAGTSDPVSSSVYADSVYPLSVDSITNMISSLEMQKSTTLFLIYLGRPVESTLNRLRGNRLRGLPYASLLTIR